MKVLVLGATGYVGNSVCEALAAQGHGVIALSRSANRHEGLARLGVERVNADLSDVDEIGRAASRSEAAVYAAGPRSADAEAIERAALEAIGRALPHRAGLLYVSGCSVYGQSDSRPADEGDPVVENAKTRSEQVVMSARQLTPMIVRAGLVHGRGGGILGRLAAHGSAEGEVPVPEGDWTWSVVHVDDLASLIVRMLEQPEPGITFNASEQRSVTIMELAERAAESAGPDVKVRPGAIHDIAHRIGGVAYLLNRHAVIRSRRAEDFGWTRQRSF